MPRLSSKYYLVARSCLLDDSSRKRPVLASLSYVEQRTLHDYFAFTQSLTDADALVHRKTVTASQPSLPHRAGKVMRHFQEMQVIGSSHRPLRPQSLNRRSKKIRGVARPKPDLERIAAVIAHQLLENL